MTAPARRRVAAESRALAHSPSEYGASQQDIWSQAVAVRRGWLRRALDTQPADRDRAEHGIARIYARLRRPRPRFEWVDSPAKALPLVAGRPTLDDLYRRVRSVRHPADPPPIASDLAVLVSRLRGALSAGVFHPDPELTPARMGRHKDKTKDRWPDLPPLPALAAGVPLGVVLHRGIRNALHTSLVPGYGARVRAELARDGGPVPVCWYGQLDAFWVGYYDALRRLGLARYPSDEAEGLDDWAALAECTGWWWPGEDVCVAVDRPAQVTTEPVPGGFFEEVRLTGVHYRDGWRAG